MTGLRRYRFGKLSNGEEVEAFDLETDGLAITLMSFGATLQAIRVPDSKGRVEDVTLGYDELAMYETHPQHFGVSVGRFANRIAKGRFSLDGRDYQLETNNGPNHLHGGSYGFGVTNWRVAETGETPHPFVTFALTSPDGDGGYPGTLEARATYALTGPGELTLTYEAETDAPTICNLTNHAFFNLGGALSERDILGHELTLAADRFLPVDETWIPTGEVRPVAATPFDFREKKLLSSGVRDGGDTQVRIGRGFDHCMVLADETRAEPQFGARIEDPVTGRAMEMATTAPGIQFYSGNFLNGSIPGKGGRLYRMGDGLCLEPQLFPDSPNQPSFPSARLDPGETFRQVSRYRFFTA
ncbi:aldose 1-epimerase [Fulvimarina pelagi HTCC2506]|uniref:Aldose 1-epimerase n=2 Tax=Fulvimarina pelagi TaxID=217511 RepID=Q0FZV7_9HYPH|nr:aldose epimerase family protein [Fulvimarina pelagi]EAU40484.1 aldose 1-epimerase [Fulvimarina pelagi HTCC2506]BAT31510.1 aldose 1-epimerase [Fulvimarina pelagi]